MANPTRATLIVSSTAPTSASTARPIAAAHAPRLRPLAHPITNPPSPRSTPSSSPSSYEESPHEIRRACCAHCSAVFLTAYSSGGETYCGLDCRTMAEVYLDFVHLAKERLARNEVTSGIELDQSDLGQRSVTRSNNLRRHLNAQLSEVPKFRGGLARILAE